MDDLVWIIDNEKDLFLGRSGVSSSYILPKNEVDYKQIKLTGRRLWVVLRGREDRLFITLKIKKTERIIDDYYSGDYLISPEITESIKLASNYDGAAKYTTKATASLGLGVFYLPHLVSNEFSALVRGSMQTKFIQPDTRLLSRIDFKLFPNDGPLLAKSALSAVISHFTLEQVWDNGTGDRIGAFPNYASALISEKTGVELSPNLVHDLKTFDPMRSIFSKKKQFIKKTVQDYDASYVDKEFYRIEPDKIYAREFVSLDPKFNNLEDALNKTEHAEKVHQAMLKDISEFLIINGVTPYESGSIDLLYASNKRLNLIEIKSANIDNVLSQSSKGAFQLACYINELDKYYDNLNARLVLHATEDIGLQNYAVKALSRLGIEVLIYDPRKTWPKRMPGLPL